MNIVFYRLCQSLLYILFKVWNRLQVYGSKSLPAYQTGYIIAANHASYLDPPVIGASFRRPVIFLAKEPLFEVGILGRVITLLGALPVKGADQYRSLRAVIRALKGGKCVVVFPEGARSVGSNLMQPEPGVAFLAHAAQVPIIPCYISGSDEAWPRGTRRFSPKKIEVFIGQPFTVGDTSREDREQYYEECAHVVMQRILELKEKASQKTLGP